MPIESWPKFARLLATKSPMSYTSSDHILLFRDDLSQQLEALLVRPCPSTMYRDLLKQPQLPLTIHLIHLLEQHLAQLLILLPQMHPLSPQSLDLPLSLLQSLSQPA